MKKRNRSSQSLIASLRNKFFSISQKFMSIHVSVENNSGIFFDKRKKKKVADPKWEYAAVLSLTG